MKLWMGVGHRVVLAINTAAQGEEKCPFQQSRAKHSQKTTLFSPIPFLRAPQDINTAIQLFPEKLCH
jgi:hypothetical protein